MIRGIIFDYGGTIDSRGEHWIHVLRRGWKAAGLEVPEEDFRQAYVTGERTLARERIILPQDNFHTLLYKKAKIALEALPQQFQPADAERSATAIADYCDASARICVEEARPTLESFAAKHPLCLVSNFYGNVDAVLRAYGIRHCFSHIIESAVVGVRKPDPRIFMLGVVALGFKPQEVLVIGDSLKKDIMPAESIGCQTVWIKGPGWDDRDESSSHPFISSLTELEIP